MPEELKSGAKTEAEQPKNTEAQKPAEGGGAEGAKPAETAAPAAPPAPSEWERTFGDKIKPADILAHINAQAAEIKRLTELTAGAGKPVSAPGSAKATPDMRDLILDDPEAVLEQYFQRRIAPIIQPIYEHAEEVTRNVVAERRTVGPDGKERPEMPLFRRFEKEITEFVSKVDPRLRHRPETWKTAYYQVVGQNLDAIVQERIAAMAPAVESGGAGGSATGAKSHNKLTPEEAAVAVHMGMTPEEYLQWKEA